MSDRKSDDGQRRESDYREPLSDEAAERMERGLRLLHTPPKLRGKNPTPPAEAKSAPSFERSSAQG
jgi:hypothetical protein